MDDKPHSHRLRIGRRSEPGACYLLTTCCDGRAPLLSDARAAEIVLETLHWLDGNERMELFAAVAMPDHVHFIGALRHVPLDGLMHSLKGCSRQRINRKLGRCGRFWQPGYHDRALRSEQSVDAAIRYCLQNPVRAGLAVDFREYPHCWSKWRE